jgi:hypothetical protein
MLVCSTNRSNRHPQSARAAERTIQIHRARSPGGISGKTERARSRKSPGGIASGHALSVRSLPFSSTLTSPLPAPSGPRRHRR